MEQNNEAPIVVLVITLKVSLMSTGDKKDLRSLKVEENVCFAHNCVSVVSLLFRSAIWRRC